MLNLNNQSISKVCSSQLIPAQPILDQPCSAQPQSAVCFMMMLPYDSAMSVQVTGNPHVHPHVHPCISPDSSVTAPSRLSVSPVGVQAIRAMSASVAILAIKTLGSTLRACQLDKVPAWLAAHLEQLSLGSCKKGTDIQLHPMSFQSATAREQTQAHKIAQHVIACSQNA